MEVGSMSENLTRLLHLWQKNQIFLNINYQNNIFNLKRYFSELIFATRSPKQSKLKDLKILAQPVLPILYLDLPFSY